MPSKVGMEKMKLPIQKHQNHVTQAPLTGHDISAYFTGSLSYKRFECGELLWVESAFCVSLLESVRVSLLNPFVNLYKKEYSSSPGVSNRHFILSHCFHLFFYGLILLSHNAQMNHLHLQMEPARKRKTSPVRMISPCAM